MVNNMGNMTKQEARNFFDMVVADLELEDFGMEFTPTAPSICLGDKILIYEPHLNGYPWQIKEEILHELAHHLSQGDKKHGKDFYKAYIMLLEKYASMV